MDYWRVLQLFGDLLSAMIAPLMLSMAAIALASKNFREEEGGAFTLIVAACALLGAAELFLALYDFSGLALSSLVATVFRLSALVLILQVIRVKLRAGFKARKLEEKLGSANSKQAPAH